MSSTRKVRAVLIAGITAGAAALSSCSPGALGSSTANEEDPSGNVTITMLADNTDHGVKIAQSLVDAFNAKGTGTTVKMENRTGGVDGDNVIKTKLATSDMADVFAYNSGSLMQALDPARNLVPLDGDAAMANVLESYLPAVTFDGHAYGVPIGQAMGGGILYNKRVFADLDLDVPKTWAEFMANNAKIKDAGIDPVLGTYGDTWTSQLLILADFHNVTSVQPDWAERYTVNDAKYADEPALKGFQRLEEVYQAGYLNKDFASLKQGQGLQRLVDGEVAQYPMLTFVTPAYVDLADDAAETIGFFAQPGDDAETNGLTTWMPFALYIPKTVTGQKLEAAKEFLAFVASTEGCDAQNAAVPPNGPYLVQGCALPEGLPTVVTDLQQYIDDGNTSLALEYLSPIKGPNLEKITVEVGSGMATALEGAERYDEDVKKQAQQLGLEGW